MHRTYPFTVTTFAVLEDIYAAPTKRFYDSHKEDLKLYVQQPFQRVLRRVAKTLPSQIRSMMETEAHLFSRFLKNDYGRGGAWDFYWGAFYTRGGRRTEGAQLYLCIDRHILKCGFFLGLYADEHRDRFVRNCRAHGPALLAYLRRALPDHTVSFGGGQTGADTAVAGVIGSVHRSWESYLQNPGKGEYEICIQSPKQQVLRTGEDELVAWITDADRKLFPLVLLASSDDPLPLIDLYLTSAGRLV
jgi:glutathione S-transferase